MMTAVWSGRTWPWDGAIAPTWRWPLQNNCTSFFSGWGNWLKLLLSREVLGWAQKVSLFCSGIHGCEISSGYSFLQQYYYKQPSYSQILQGLGLFCFLEAKCLCFRVLIFRILLWFTNNSFFFFSRKVYMPKIAKEQILVLTTLYSKAFHSGHSALLGSRGTTVEKLAQLYYLPTHPPTKGYHKKQNHTEPQLKSRECGGCSGTTALALSSQTLVPRLGNVPTWIPFRAPSLNSSYLLCYSISLWKMIHISVISTGQMTFRC